MAKIIVNGESVQVAGERRHTLLDANLVLECAGFTPTRHYNLRRAKRETGRLITSPPLDKAKGVEISEGDEFYAEYCGPCYAA